MIEDVFEKLKDLQDILSEKIALEQKIQEIPKLLVTQQELLARMKKTFFEKIMDHDRAKAAEVEYRNAMAIAEANRERAEKHAESASTQREWEALDKEMQDASGKEQEFRSKLQREERIIAELDEQMKQNQALIEQQEKELEERRRSIEAEVAEKQAQMEALYKQEKGITPYLDPEVLFKFERIIRNKMGRGIVAIKGGVCMGCHMVLPVQFANMVRMGEEIVFCPYCSRILFYEESSEDGEDYFAIEDTGSLSDLDDIDEDEYDEEEEEDNSSLEYEE